jgi:hypothetical protein
MRFRRKRVVVWVSLLVIVAAGAFWAYRSFNPPWRVRVHLTNIPVGTNFVSLVADSGEALRNMEWSPNSELSVPFTMHPARCIWSFQNPDRPKVDWHAYVRWQPGERYGVVTRSRDGTWRISWFEADSAPIRGRRWLLGGGEASFDITAGRTVPLSAEQVRTLGLDKVVDLN